MLSLQAGGALSLAHPGLPRRGRAPGSHPPEEEDLYLEGPARGRACSHQAFPLHDGHESRGARGEGVPGGVPVPRGT